MMHTFSPLNNSPEEIKQESALLKLVFKKDHFTENFLNWQYNENPDGKAVGFNAHSETAELAGHYVTQPMSAFLFGKETKGLLSLNTATHPNHQGKGIFTELAKKTYAHAGELGYEFVIGVANQNSTHGFITKLGFKFVGKLKAVIASGNPCEKYDDKNFNQFDFIRNWNKKTLHWRIANPANKYCINDGKIISDSGKTMIKAVLGNFDKTLLPSSENKISKPFSLGIGTELAIPSGISIPGFLRPSPLNLIFKDLTGKNRAISFDKTYFACIDFDGY